MSGSGPVSTFVVDDDVYGIDLGWFDTRAMAAYLIDSPEPTLVETGFPKSVGRLRAGLAAVGVRPSELKHAFISHIHLDHAGGASDLIADAPELAVYIHESVVEHLVTPERLVESSRRAMGDHFDAIGAPGPLPEANIVPIANDGMTVHIGDRDLEVYHTPGHSPDHISLWEPANRRLWATEAIGSYYPKAERWVPPATLPRFDPDAVHESIATLRSLDPRQLVLSHYGIREDPASAFNTASERLTDFTDRIPSLFESVNGDIERTEAAVRRELLDLERCSEALVSFETKLQTRGFLKYHGLV